jgi:hypothetical protein
MELHVFGTLPLVLLIALRPWQHHALAMLVLNVHSLVPVSPYLDLVDVIGVVLLTDAKV